MGISETFTYQGEMWTRYPAPPPSQAYLLGCDLGQSQDHTAIVVMHHTRTPLDEWRVDQKAHTTKQVIEENFDVVFAERLPLGTSYPEVIEHITKLLGRPPLRNGCYFVLDESGVGRAVGDEFDKVGLKPIRVIITAGVDQNKLPGHPRRWSVSKVILTSGVDAKLNAGELRFALGLAEAANIANELKNFRRHLTAAGRATYAARTGQHDDLVLSVALCTWWATERCKHQVRTGPLLGLY